MVEHTIAQLETGIPESLTCKPTAMTEDLNQTILEPCTDITKDVNYSNADQRCRSQEIPRFQMQFEQVV